MTDLRRRPRKRRSSSTIAFHRLSIMCSRVMFSAAVLLVLCSAVMAESKATQASHNFHAPRQVGDDPADSWLAYTVSKGMGSW